MGPTERLVGHCKRETFFFEGRATDLLRRLRLAFRDVIGISFTLSCVALTDDALRWRLSGL